MANSIPRIPKQDTRKDVELNLVISARANDVLELLSAQQYGDRNYIVTQVLLAYLESLPPNERSAELPPRPIEVATNEARERATKKAANG
jgi:hypothetical protein